MTLKQFAQEWSNYDAITPNFLFYGSSKYPNNQSLWGSSANARLQICLSPLGRNVDRYPREGSWPYLPYSRGGKCLFCRMTLILILLSNYIYIFDIVVIIYIVVEPPGVDRCSGKYTLPYCNCLTCGELNDSVSVISNVKHSHFTFDNYLSLL